MKQEKKIEQKDQNRLLPEESLEMKHWKELVTKGYISDYQCWSIEDITTKLDLEHGRIRLGIKDMNEKTIPTLPASKDAWIATAKLILTKYGKE